MRFPHVEAANAVAISTLSEHIPDTINGLKLVIYGGLQVPRTLRLGLWSIFESNMKSFGELDRLEKEEEWFHPNARLLVLTDEAGSVPRASSNSRSTPRGPPIAAYGVFRFDTEENENDGEDEVLYCYELQISESVKRSGIGRSIIELMEMLGTQHGMKKIVLTCFKENTNALAFYKKLGFDHDPICPSVYTHPDADEDEEEEEVDYFILSKPLVQQKATSQ